MPGRGHSPYKGSEVGSRPRKEALELEGSRGLGGIWWVGSSPKGEEVGWEFNRGDPSVPNKVD